MHTVTKILVVFAAILAVLLAALTMAYSVNASRITGDYRAAVEKATNAQTTANSLVAEKGEALTAKESQLQQIKNQVGDLENQIRSLQSEKAELMTRVKKAEGDRDADRAEKALLAASNQTQAALIQKYSDEVTKLREGELTASKQRIELENRINDLEGQLEVAVAGTRALQEQLVEVQRALQASGGVRVGDTASTSGDPVVPTFAVAGKVTDVTKDVSGKDSATINLGTNNRLRENMQLSVFRGEKFIGHLILKRTDLQSSYGVIEYRGQKQPIQAGDEVKSLAAR